MIARKWLAAAVAGTALGAVTPAGAVAAEATAVKPVYTFGTLRAMPADAAKGRLEAWLKAAGKYDPTAFAAAWADDTRPVGERVLATITTALPAAAAALAEAARPDAPAPTDLPAVLKDDKLDPFVRANLAVAYAKALGGRRVYEEALDALKKVPAEQVADPAGFYFYKAVAEHALMQRDAATTSILRLLDDVTDAPDRYRMVATLMFFDIQAWPKDDKDLSNIGRLMENSERRLDLARGGPKTQDIQKKIVFRLDEKIKELEKKGGGGGGGCNGGQCPSGGGAPSGGPGGNPATDSYKGGITGKGEVDVKKLRQYAETWGTLPAAERAKAKAEMTRDVPPQFRAMVEDYFKALNRRHGFQP